MSAPVEFLPAAQADVQAAYQWYEDRREGLGGEFEEALDVVIRRIEHSPTLHTFAFEPVRFAVTLRFPYVVYYRADAERTLILGVLHARRDSALILDRSEGFS